MGNRYDTADIVRRVFLMNAEGLKFASYRVRDMASPEDRPTFSELQHHLTYVPTKSFDAGGTKHVMVNEIGATIYGMLEDEQAKHLAEVVVKIKAEGDAFTERAYVDLDKSRTVIQVYRHPTTGKPDLQVYRGPHLLALLSLSMAEMFCTLAERARGGATGLLGDPLGGVIDAVPAEITGMVNGPKEPLDPKTLDA